MTEEEWDALPVESIPLNQLVFMLNGLNVLHLFPTFTPTKGPIRVARLNRGYLIRDGRHRAIRAMIAGHTYIEARVGDS